MSVSIDEKVVEMRFNNKQFEQGIQTSLKSISDLNKATEFTAAQKGVKDLQHSFTHLNLGTAVQAVEGLSLRVSALGVAGAEVIRRITDSAIDMGKRLAGVISKPVELAKSGGIARALNIEQAQFQLEGLGVKWKEIEKDIDYGVKDTAYGLDAAAKVASQLVASNVSLGKEMAGTLRGISGVAAMTGSTYEDIGNIFTTVAGNGKLMTIQLHQLAGRGLNIAAELAKQLHKSEAEIRQMVTDGKIDFKTFAKAMDDAFGQHAKDANKTFTGAMSNVKAALSRIGALFATPFHHSVIAPLNSLKDLINTIKEAMVKPTDLLGKFMENAGHFADRIMQSEHIVKAVKNTTVGIMNVFKFFGKILNNVAAAFLDVFPPKTVQSIGEMAKHFKDMSKHLTLTEEQMSKLQNVARGVFSVFSILGNVIGFVFDIIKDIAHSKAGDLIGKAVQAIANGLQTISYFVKVVRVAYKTVSKEFGGIGGVLKHFGTLVSLVFSVFEDRFRNIGGVFSVIVDEIKEFASKASEAFKGMTDGVKSFASAVKDKLGKAGEALQKIFDSIGNSISKTDKKINEVTHRSSILVTILRGLAVVAKVVVAAFGAILNAIGGLLRDMDWGKIIEEGISLVIIDRLGELVGKVTNFMKNLKDGFTNTTSMADQAKSTLKTISGAFNEFQKSMQTGRLLMIAATIGILSLSLLELSKIGSLKELGIAIAALASISSVLVILSKSFDKLGDGKFIKKGALQLVIMAAALKILSKALLDLSVLNFDQLSNGAIALAATMAIMVGAFNMMASTSEKGKIFTKSSKKWVKGAYQLVLMAAAVKILASVVVQLGKLDYQSLAKGLTGLVVVLGALSGAAVAMGKFDGKIGLRTGISIVSISAGIVIIAQAVKTLGALDLPSLVKGLASTTLIIMQLAGVGMAMGVLETKITARTGMALMMVAGAVVIMSKAVEKMGAMDTNSLLRGLIGLTGSMTVVAGIAKTLSTTEINQNAGIAIDLIAIAISSIAGSVEKLGNLDVNVLQRGLIAAGAALVGLVGVLAALDKVSTSSSELLKGAAAMVVMATSLKMIGTAVATIGILTTDEIARGIAALVGPLIALSTAAIAMKGAIKGAAAMAIVAGAMVLLAPAIVLMGSAPMDSVSQSLQVLGVIIAATAAQMIILGIGAKIFKKSIGTILKLSTSMLVGAASFAIFAGGALLLVKAIEILVHTIGAIADAGKSLFEGFKNLGEGIANLFIGFFSGLEKGAGEVIPAIGKFIGRVFAFIGSLIKEKIPDLVRWAFEVVIEFIEGIADAIETYLPQLLKAIGKVGIAIMKTLKKVFSNLFTELNAGDLIKIGFIIAAITLMFKTLSNSIAQIKPANIAGAVVLVAGVVAVAYSLIQLSTVPWENLLAAVGAMSLSLLTLTYMLQSLSDCKFSVTSIAAMAIGASSLLIIGKTLSSLGKFDWKSLLAAGTAMSMVLGVYGAIFTVLATKNSVTPASLANIGLFALGTLALIPVAATLKELAKSDWKSMGVAAAALTSTFVGYAAVFAVLSMIPIAGAIGAIANLAIALGGLAAILLVLGAIKQIPGVEWLVSEGSEFANQLGEAIGGFVGSIVSGFGKALSSMLPQIGQDLSDFMTNATPFFDEVQAIGSDTMEAVSSLASALIKLTATELIQGIASFFGADVNFKEFGQQLSDFADGMVVFAEKTAGLNVEDVEKASHAAAMLGEFASSVPLKGGLLSDLMGDRDLTGFAEALPKLGEGLAKFGKKTKKLDVDSVNAATNAAKMLGELNSDIPLHGGLLGDLMGERDLAGFGEALPSLGEGLSKFAKKTKKLNVDSIASATNAARMLIELNQNIPLTGGVLGFLAGDRDLSGFAEDLPELGTALKDFATNTTGLNAQAATDAATVAKMLGALAADLPNSGGIASWFTGDSSLEEFGEQLPDFGTNIKEFGDNIAGIDNAAINTASGLVNTVVNMLNYANNQGVSATYVGEFASSLETFGKAYKQFIQDSATNASSVKDFANGMNSIIKVIKKISKVDTSKIAKFASDLKGLTDAGIQDVKTASENTMDAAINAISGKKEEFKTAGEEYVKSLASGITKGSYLVKDAMITSAKNAANATRADYIKGMFKTSGQNLVDGFAEGMNTDDRIQKVINAAKKVAQAAKNTINKELDINSPSKVMEETGEFTVEGFSEGIEDNTGYVSSAATNMVDTYETNVSKGLKMAQRKLAKKGSGVLDSVKNAFSDAMSGIKDTAGSGSSKLSWDSLGKEIGLGKDTKKTEEKAKDDGKKVGTAAATGVSSGASNAGKSTSKTAKFTKKQLEEALKAYHNIVGVYTKKIGKAFSQKELFTSMTKKGKGQLKITSKYLLSGINNKYLRTAASKLGTDIAKVINSSMRSELKKKDATSAILEKLDSAGQNLVDARKRKKQANSTIKNSKSHKAIAKAKKELAAANKDIEKYQKQVDKYQEKLKKAGASVAKNLTQQVIGELNNKMNEFKALFNSMGNKTGNVLYKIPSVLSAYISNVKSSSTYAKGVVKAVESTFKSNVATLDKATNKTISKYESKLKDAKAKEKAAKKVINSKSSSAKEKKKAEKDLKAAEKTILNLNTKIAKEKEKLGGAGIVDKFAERLYYSSDNYKNEVKNVKASTKKIQKIQKDAKKVKQKLDKATKAEDKKKYADQLKDLNKQYKAEEKLLKKSATNIAKGPEKALKSYKKTIKETFKSMLSIASLEISPKIQLDGFDKFEQTKNLVQDASVNSDIFAKAIANAGDKFSIFGDISAKATNSFEFFNGAISTGINLLERFTKVGSVEKQALFENADSQLEAYEEFYKGIEQLRSRNLSDVLIEDLKSQGPEALNYIRGFLSMSDEEIASYNNRVAKMNAYGAANYANEIKASMLKAQKFSSSLAELATLGVREEIIENFKEMGAESAQGYVDSLLSAKETIGELNSLYDDYAKASSRSMLEAAQEQYKASLSYDKMITDLKNTILDPSIIKEIEAMGRDEAMAYGRSILSNIQDIPSLNELYWKSQTNDKTMRQQMEAANADANAFAEGLKILSGYGLHDDFVQYVKDLGIDEGMAVIQRAVREFGSLSADMRAEEVKLFNAEYLKSQNNGKSPMEVMLENLGSQVEGYDKYTANLDIVLSKLGGDTKSEYFKYLKEMGMDGAEYVEALANATEDQIQKYREMIDAREERNRRERAQSVIDSWNEQLSTIQNYTSNVATLIKQGASQTLIDDLASMDIKEAAEKVDALLAMDKDAFNSFNTSYDNMMSKDVGTLVNNLVGVYAAAGETASKGAAEVAQKSVDFTIDTVVKGADKTVTAQSEAYKNATVAKYPEYQATSTSAAQATADAFTNTLSQNIGAIPLDSIVKAFKKGLEDKKVAKKLVSAGNSICNGIMTGIEEKKLDLAAVGNDVSRFTVNQFKNYINKNNGMTMAYNFCKAISDTFVLSRPGLVNTAQTIASGINAKFATYLSYSQGYYYGKMMAQGVADGLNSMVQACWNAANSIIAAANAAAAARAQLGSPSKLWHQYGVWMGEGLSLGLDAATDRVEGSAESLVDNANSALQETLDQIRAGIDGELDFNPVITPTLDLSKVTAQARNINSMMENSTIGANVQYVKTTPEDENQNGSNVVYNFEQNNYSPKALSREEIYRQTRNQFAQAREALR